MDEPGMRRLLRRQAGLATRRQLAEVAVTKPDLDRLLRRKELVRVHPGVFVDHTGELTDLQRAWAAVLYAAPAALCLESALDLTSDPVHVAVDWSRRLVAPPPGVRIHRVRGLAARALEPVAATGAPRARRPRPGGTGSR